MNKVYVVLTVVPYTPGEIQKIFANYEDAYRWEQENEERYRLQFKIEEWEVE